MPLIRFIHAPDIREWGDKPVVVEDVQAKVLTEMRRAVLVTEDDLAELKKAELVDLADEAGVDVPKRDAKGHFVKALADPEVSQ
jgi:hypothetical protein